MKKILAILLLCQLSFGLQANNKSYAIASLGFTDVELAHASSDGASYKLGLGYQFHPQWYVEFGYQQLANDSLDLGMALSQLASFEPKLQGEALFVALLGKASNQMGELFYRLGLLNTDTKGLYLGSDEFCDTGTVYGLNANNQALCQFDEGALAGNIGIGFDFYLGHRHMLRVEAEHLQGEDDLQASGLYVGYRYNF